MSESEVFEMIKEYFIKEFEIEEEELDPEKNLFADMGLDSLDALNMAGMLESRMDIKMEEEELKGIRTMNDVVKYVMSHATV